MKFASSSRLEGRSEDQVWRFGKGIGGHAFPLVKKTTHVGAKLVVQMRRDQFGHRYLFKLDLLSRAFLRKEKLIDRIVVQFQGFHLFTEIGVSAFGSEGMVPFPRKSGNVVLVVFAVNGWASS